MAALEPLKLLIREHFADPFPESVQKGEDYGFVEPVMVDADTYGWVLAVADGRRLRGEDRDGLRTARNELRDSLAAFPVEARPYYERLVEMATIALDEGASISRCLALH